MRPHQRPRDRAAQSPSAASRRHVIGVGRRPARATRSPTASSRSSGGAARGSRIDAALELCVGRHRSAVYSVRPRDDSRTCTRRACGARLRRAARAVALGPGVGPALARRGVRAARCARCGSAVTPARRRPALHESGAYRPGAPRLCTRRRRRCCARSTASAWRWCARSCDPGARLLDAGAGRGRFVAAARAAGTTRSGSSRRPRRPAAAGRRRRAVSTDRGGDRSRARVDAVTLWHVLEHLDDPRRRARPDLRTGSRPAAGSLVGVPNLASLQARLGGERWYHLDVPRHRVHFTPAGLRGAARARTGSRRCDTRPRAARAQPVRDVAVARQPADPPPVVPLQPAEAKRPAALARPGDHRGGAAAGAARGARSSCSPAWRGAAARSRCWRGASSDRVIPRPHREYHCPHGRKWLRRPVRRSGRAPAPARRVRRADAGRPAARVGRQRDQAGGRPDRRGDEPRQHPGHDRTAGRAAAHGDGDTCSPRPSRSCARPARVFSSRS